MLELNERISLRVAEIKQHALATVEAYTKHAYSEAWRNELLRVIRLDKNFEYLTQVYYRNNPHLLRRDWGTDPEKWPEEILF
jgi:hypothetical protein